MKCSCLGIARNLAPYAPEQTVVIRIFRSHCAYRVYPKNLENIVKPFALQEKQSKQISLTSSMRLTSERLWVTTNHSARCFQFIVYLSMTDVYGYMGL